MIRRLILVISILVLVPIVPAQATEAQLKVMSRNLYLGADVGVAMKLLPKFSDAAQFMWDQMKANDLDRKSTRLNSSH